MKNINTSPEKKIIKSPNEKSNKERVKFLFFDQTSLDFDKSLIEKMSPSILVNVPIKNNFYEIRAPYGITKEDFSTFLFIYSNISYRNGQIIGSNCKKLYSILKLMDFFNNEMFNIQIITYIIIPELNSNIAIDLIIFSYDKLCYFSERGREADNAYFELFYQALEELSKNEMMIIKNIDKLKSLDGKIIEELIQKTFRNLIFGKYLIEKREESTINNNNSNIDCSNQMNYFEENEVSVDYFERKKLEEAKNNNNSIRDNSKIINLNNLKNLIDFLIKINDLDNIFSLLTKEYMSLLSSESISEIQSMPNPSFQVKIPISLYENYYQEFPLETNINNQILTLVIFYKIGDKSINACIKLSSKNKEKNRIINNDNYNNNKYSFEILTFLTNVVVTKGKEQKITIQNNLTSLTNNKSMYSILKIPHFNTEINNINSNTNFSNNINNEYNGLNNNNNYIGVNNNNNNEKDSDYFLITVQIKLCYIYSVISSYLLQDFNNYVNDKNISKLSKQLFILLLKNQKLNKKNENNLVKSILLWLNDEINIKEDISEIFYLIKWEEIDDDLIFELLIKYSHIILNDDTLENFFLEIYLNKFGQNNIVKSVVVKLFKAMKKVEYHKLFCQVKNDEKRIENYKAQKIKFEKQTTIGAHKKHKKTEQEKKSIDDYTQTEPEIVSFGNGVSQNMEEIKDDANSLQKQNCFWNVSRIKNLVKNKNSSNSSKSNNSLNEILKNNSKNKTIKKEKDNNEIPKPKININSNSSMPNSKEIEKNQKKVKNNRNDNNSHKELNKNISINSNKDKHTIKTNNSAEIKGNEKHSIKRSKSNKSLKNFNYNKKVKNNQKNKNENSNTNKNNNNKNKNNNNNNNISVMKKPDNKIKEMLIFPYNFSALKKFHNNLLKKENNIINNNNNKNNSNTNNMTLSSKKMYNRNIESKNNICDKTFMKNDINLSHRPISLGKNKYNTGRGRNYGKINDKPKDNTKNTKDRAYSETRIKINIGIVKEICFMNNNNNI